MVRFRVIALVWLVLLVSRAAAAQVAVRDRTLQQREARPGETYDGTIVVMNTSDAPREVRLYQTDYLYYADGRVLFNEPGTDPRSNARWITVSSSLVTVPAHSEVTVPYTVRVPADSSLSLVGSYWSVIMVEPVPPPGAADGAGRGSAPGLALTVEVRYGVQVVTHIAGTGAVRVDFEDARVVDGPDGRTLEVDIRNTGDRSAPVAVRVELFGATGERVATHEATVRILHPGTSVRRRFALGRLAGAVYEAMVTADTGEDVFGAQYTLRL